MIGFWTPIFAFIQRFFSAWGRAIRSELPEGWGDHLRLVTPPHILTIGPDDDLEALFAACPADKEVLVRFDKGLMIRRSFQVSREGLREVSKVAALEAERLMPLKTDALNLTYELKDQIGEGPRQVDIVAARKSLIKDTLRMARKYGLELADVVASGGDEAKDSRFRIPPIQRRKILRVSVVCGLVALIFSTLISIPKVYKARLESEIAALDVEIREARKNTESLASLQRQMREMQSLNVAVDSVRMKGQVLELIRVLSELSPDTVWLEQFRLDGNRVILSGEAEAAEEWVIALEDQDMFENVVLSSIRAMNGQEKRKFEVRSEVIWSSWSEETPQ